MERRSWFRTALSLKGSVVPATLPRTLVCGVFAGLISVAYYFKLPVSIPVLGSLIPSVVLGLLLVFRTNTAYERFWEGRKSWGLLITSVRNLARLILVAVEERTPEDRVHKLAMLRFLVAFAVATKLHLRKQKINDELADLLPSPEYFTLKNMNNPPIEIAFWIGDYLQQQHRLGKISVVQLTSAHRLVDNMIEALGVCERILKTPIPIAYAIHLKQLLLIFCLSLPFQMVAETEWLTGPIVALISFTLLGIEAIGIEIENPFGKDANDLPLDEICTTMIRNMDDLSTLTPSTRKALHVGELTVLKPTTDWKTES